MNDISRLSQEQEVNIEEKRIKKFRNIQITNQINVFLRSRSFFYMWFKGVLTDPAARHFKYDYNAYQVESNIQLLENALQKMNNYFLKKNIAFKVIVLPYEFQTRGDNCFNNFSNPQKILTKILDKLNVNYSNYMQNFCTHKISKELFYKFDPMHLSIKGHNFVYKLLKEDI